jgi:hypothetical protein
MFTCPGERRFGIVSLRLSCAVNPPAAHAATPSEPLPSGKDCESARFGRPSTTSERETTPPTSVENAPCCHAVVSVAAAARVVNCKNAETGTAIEMASAAIRTRR